MSGTAILLIEDTEDLGEMIRDILMMEGFEVTWARNGSLGLEQFARTQPKLIITDVVMPVMSGLEVVKAIRAQPEHRSVPIIILSAKTSPEDQTLGYEAGANLYLKKPCSGPEIVAAVRSLISQANNHGHG